MKMKNEINTDAAATGVAGAAASTAASAAASAAALVFTTDG